MTGSNTEPVERSVRAANKRGAARLAAVQALYQMELTDAKLMDIVAEYENLRLGKEVDGETYLAADESWFRGIVGGVVSDQRAIDPLIHGALPNDWPLDRLHTLLRAVLRAGVFELRSRKDVPVKVIINEYVEVAKSFFEEDEPRLVNGVLDTVGKAVRPY